MTKLPSLKNRLRDAIPRPSWPSFSWPTLGRVTEIPVYVIHTSAKAEDYFFIFDFEQFVERSREGVFVRPRLKVWAGRDDFDRRRFARQFREAFAREFDAARCALERVDAESGGWFGWLRKYWGMDDLGLIDMASSLLANIVLLLATTTGKIVWSALPIPAWVRGPSDAEKLERSIEETQGKVDEALAALTITLHMDLYRHAWRGRAGGRLTGMDYQAWPLPGYVQDHLGDCQSGSWW